jgi:hypothetical protein
LDCGGPRDGESGPADCRSNGLIPRDVHGWPSPASREGCARYCRAMRIAILGLGIVVACFGALWALQGFGVVGGSPMSNTTTWSVIGPIVALVGIAIAGFGARMRK